MTKLTLASYPHMLGFEQLERVMERTAKAGNEGYPPFNIEQTSDYSYRITLAVAGFAEQDLSITVEDRQLVIRGRQVDAQDERIFLLHVDLTRAKPEKVVQTIKIRKGE